MKKTIEKSKPIAPDDPVGNGGEPHKRASDTHFAMTTQTVATTFDDENSLKVGPRDPMLVEEHVLFEKFFFKKTRHFDRERIPRRILPRLKIFSRKRLLHTVVLMSYQLRVYP
ncbi:MAG: hypothetical protein ABI197_14705 [Granulicella sp.]